MVQMHMMIVNYGCGTCRSKPCANSFAPMFGARAERDAHMVTFLGRRAKRGALLFAFSFWGTSGARCPYGDVFLRLRASEAKRLSLYCSAFTSVLVFFSRDIPSAFVLIEGYFLRAYFSATIQTFQKETQLDALSNRVKTFRKFSTGAILLASKARNFRKFLGFLSILLFFFSQTTANWPDVGTNRRKTMFSLIW